MGVRMNRDISAIQIVPANKFFVFKHHLKDWVMKILTDFY